MCVSYLVHPSKCESPGHPWHGILLYYDFFFCYFHVALVILIDATRFFMPSNRKENQNIEIY